MIHQLLTAVLCLQLAAGVPAPQTQSGINEVKRMITSINQNMPVDIEDVCVYQRIEYDANARSVIFHVYVDEDVDGNFELDEDDDAETAAVLIALLKYSSDVMAAAIEEHGVEQFNALGKDNPEIRYLLNNQRFFEKIGPLLDKISDQDMSITVRVQSKDGFTHDMFLSPDDVTDVLIYAEDIINDPDEDM